MLSKEEVRSILNKCDTCKLTECIGCDITYTERNKIREYIEQLERTIKTMSKEITHKQDEYCEHYCNALIEYKQLETDKQKLIEKLEKDSSDGYEVQYKDSHEIILTQKIEPVRNYIKQELLRFVKEEKTKEV